MLCSNAVGVRISRAIAFPCAKCPSSSLAHGRSRTQTCHIGKVSWLPPALPALPLLSPWSAHLSPFISPELVALTGRLLTVCPVPGDQGKCEALLMDASLPTMEKESQLPTHSLPPHLPSPLCPSYLWDAALGYPHSHKGLERGPFALIFLAIQ